MINLINQNRKRVLQESSLPSIFDCTGVGVSFSFRLLRDDYTGFCVKVRRDSDDATLDVGFDSGFLDMDAISTFCGVGSGYIDTWYDQSTYLVTASQATLSLQPIIYDTGSFIYSGGHLVCNILGKNLTINPTSVVYSSFCAFSNATTGNSVLYGIPFTTQNSGTYAAIIRFNNSAYPASVIGSADYYKNGVQISPETRGELYTQFVTGNNVLSSVIKQTSFGMQLAYTTLYGNISMMEFISTDSTTIDQSCIEQNILNYYSIS